ncbi:MAG: septation protein IspZ [Xanthobacteraceae bacterium]|nr:septation protein IspZ [Xanthobacteraceae bacterium]
MRLLFDSAKMLLLDLASTFLFLALVLLFKNITLAVVAGMALGAAQIGWELARKQPVDAMQWLSLFVVLASGAAALITDDPRFVMIKPSLFYGVAGVVMLRPGWMTRYLPPIAKELVPDIAVLFGFAWAVLMFASAALNIYVAMNYDVVTWSAFMSMFAIVSKIALFAVGFLTMRLIGGRRRRMQVAAVAGALNTRSAS